MANLSVIIPCLNVDRFIGTQLNALASQICSNPWEVIVADNGSTDRTLMVVEQYADRLPGLQVVDASGRRGQAHARNKGAAVATGESLIFLDADDEVAPGWLAAISEGLSKYDFVASRLDIKKLNDEWVQKHCRPPQQDCLDSLPIPPFLLHASGCGLGVKAAVHRQIGGFDESLSPVEDADYCIRAQLSGAILHFVPQALIHYRYRENLLALYRQARSWSEGTVRLHEKYRTNNEPFCSSREILWKWKGLISTIPYIRDKASCGKLAWQLGWNIGLLQALIEH